MLRVKSSPIFPFIFGNDRFNLVIDGDQGGAGVCKLLKAAGIGDIPGIPAPPTKAIRSTLSFQLLYIKTKSNDPSDSTINFHYHVDRHWDRNSRGDTQMRVLTACFKTS